MTATEALPLKTQTVTLDFLVSHETCNDQITLFRETFGKSIQVTPDVLRKAADAGIDLDWAAEHLLTTPARAAYEHATATAWAAYEQAKATALIDVIFGDQREERP